MVCCATKMVYLPSERAQSYNRSSTSDITEVRSCVWASSWGKSLRALKWARAQSSSARERFRQYKAARPADNPQSAALHSRIPAHSRWP